MLDAFIIEELRRREREKRKQDEARRPRLELPLEREDVRRKKPEMEEDIPSSSSVVVIEM